MADFLDLDKEEVVRKVKLGGKEYIIPPLSVKRMKAFQERAKQLKKTGEEADIGEICHIVGDLLGEPPEAFLETDFRKLMAIIDFAIDVEDMKKKLSQRK